MKFKKKKKDIPHNYQFRLFSAETYQERLGWPRRRRVDLIERNAMNLGLDYR